MARGMRDKLRRMSNATSAAMKLRVRNCLACGRGQLPSRYNVGDGRVAWQCRYCSRVHMPKARASNAT